MRACGVALVVLACCWTMGSAAWSADVDFEQAVAPIIAKRCLECHNARDAKGGLNLTTRKGALAGGDSGEVLVPGKLEDSPLWDRVSEGEMPPPVRGQTQRLPAAEQAVLRKWIEQGAAWPGNRTLSLYERTTDVRGGLDWWALQPVKRPAVPPLRGADPLWKQHPIDAFVYARLTKAKLTPAPPADPRALVRRLYFDLIGLPPPVKTVEAFAADPSPAAYEKIVDHLLRSPRFGERWARYWLDVVRFAETCGYERDQLKPNIWRYRDWVINAINQDLPYDRFVTDQLAGDEVPYRDEQSVIATGMLRAGTWNDEPNDPADYLYERLEDMVHTTSSAFLGLTVKCARCHDHKFDPIRQTDYYRMGSFFWSGYLGQANLGGPNKDQLGFDVFGWTDRGAKAKPIRLLYKGDRHRPREAVPPGFLSAVPDLDQPLAPPPPGSKTTHRRLQLARWITDRRNPLTARVIVNRLWLHHFGQGIVRTPNNFGFKSDPPTHPRLLDWLAAELMDGGWKLKRIHKQIVTSAVYRQSSRHPRFEHHAQVDFTNRHWWHYPRRRLDAEALRDAMLAASGELNLKTGGPSFYPEMSAEALEGLSRKGNAWGRSTATERARRSIYMMTKRSRLLPLMTTFDFVDPTLPCGRRNVTTVAPQALALLNNHFVHGRSAALARRVAKQAGENRIARIEQAWRLALGRRPDAGETDAAIAHLNAQQARFARQAEAQRTPAAERAAKSPSQDKLVLWLRADRALEKDAQGRVTSWQDVSPLAGDGLLPHDASQARPSARPSWVAQAIGGQPAVRFSGKGQLLHVAGKVIWSPHFSIFAVASKSPAATGHREIFSNWHRRGRSTSSVFLGTTANATVRLTDAFSNAGELAATERGFVLSAISGRQSSRTFQNGLPLASGKPLNGRDLAAPYVIGAQGNIGGEYWHGDIAELLVYDRELGAEERQEVERYLLARYKMTPPRRPLDPKQLALASLCHVLLNTNEFIYVD